MPLALITGGAKRIGANIALSLAQAGFDIALHVNRSRNEGREMISRLRGTGNRAELFNLDFGELDKIESMFAAITGSMGNIDLVVNNASKFSYDSPASFDHALAQEHLRVNLLAPVEIIRCFADNSTQQGVVVNMLDNKLFSLNPDFFSYTMSKVALKSAAEMMAMDFAGNLRINAIAPGVTLRSGDQTSANFEKSWRKSLSGRGATPDEIANTILYIWNTKSINGETIVLDGGQRYLRLERDVAFLEDDKDR